KSTTGQSGRPMVSSDPPPVLVRAMVCYPITKGALLERHPGVACADEQPGSRSSSPGIPARFASGRVRTGGFASPEAQARARVDRVVRRGVPGLPDLEPRGRRVRDPDRLDGADPVGAASGDRLWV